MKKKIDSGYILNGLSSDETRMLGFPKGRKIDLEQILNELSSDKARRNAISQLVRKVDLSIPQEKVGRFKLITFENYEKVVFFKYMINVALKFGMPKSC